EADEGDGAWDDECGPGEESFVEGVTLLGELWGMCPPACGPHAVSTAPAIAAVKAAAVTPLILANATDLPPSAPLGAGISAGTGHVHAQAGLSAGAPPAMARRRPWSGQAGDLRPCASAPRGYQSLRASVRRRAPSPGRGSPALGGDGQYVRFMPDVR